MPLTASVRSLAKELGLTTSGVFIGSGGRSGSNLISCNIPEVSTDSFFTEKAP